ncbi:MAG: hypothetical protein ACOYL6_16245 [Bacteriovoracaceae bacterium]
MNTAKRHQFMRTINSKLILILLITIFTSTPSYASWFHNVCDYFFPDQGIPDNALNHAMPKDMLKEGSILERATLFQQKYPDRVKMLNNINLDLTTPQGNWVNQKKVLVISVKDLGRLAQNELVKEFSKHLSHNSMMFSGVGHLYIKIGNKVYDHSYSYSDTIIHERSYRISVGDFSPVVTFNDAEFSNLKGYVYSARKKYLSTIGGFEYQGAQQSMGQINNNCGLDAKHNCTSWIGLAPVGENGETIRSLTGGRNWDVHTNPTWWKGYLMTRRSEERIPFVVYFTSETTEQIEITFGSKATVDIGHSH